MDELNLKYESSYYKYAEWQNRHSRIKDFVHRQVLAVSFVSIIILLDGVRIDLVCTR